MTQAAASNFTHLKQLLSPCISSPAFPSQTSALGLNAKHSLPPVAKPHKVLPKTGIGKIRGQGTKQKPPPPRLYHCQFKCGYISANAGLVAEHAASTHWNETETMNESFVDVRNGLLTNVSASRNALIRQKLGTKLNRHNNLKCVSDFTGSNGSMITAQKKYFDDNSAQSQITETVNLSQSFPEKSAFSDQPCPPPPFITSSNSDPRKISQGRDTNSSNECFVHPGRKRRGISDIAADLAEKKKQKFNDDKTQKDVATKEEALEINMNSESPVSSMQANFQTRIGYSQSQATASIMSGLRRCKSFALRSTSGSSFPRTCENESTLSCLLSSNNVAESAADCCSSSDINGGFKLQSDSSTNALLSGPASEASYSSTFSSVLHNALQKPKSFPYQQAKTHFFPESSCSSAPIRSASPESFSSKPASFPIGQMVDSARQMKPFITSGMRRNRLERIQSLDIFPTSGRGRWFPELISSDSFGQQAGGEGSSGANRHNDVANYPNIQCVLCKEWVCARNRYMHVESHLQYKPYKCSVCSYDNRKEIFITLHINRVHHGGGEVVYEPNAALERKAWVIAEECLQHTRQLLSIDGNMTGGSSEPTKASTLLAQLSELDQPIIPENEAVNTIEPFPDNASIFTPISEDGNAMLEQFRTVYKPRIYNTQRAGKTQLLEQARGNSGVKSHRRSSPKELQCGVCQAVLLKSSLATDEHVRSHLGKHSYHCIVPGCSTTHFARAFMHRHMKEVHKLRKAPQDLLECNQQMREEFFEKCQQCFAMFYSAETIEKLRQKYNQGAIFGESYRRLSGADSFPLDCAGKKQSISNEIKMPSITKPSECFGCSIGLRFDTNNPEDLLKVCVNCIPDEIGQKTSVKCSQCSMHLYASVYTVQKHALAHMRPLPFGCSNCSYSHWCSTNLVRHCRMAHTTTQSTVTLNYARSNVHNKWYNTMSLCYGIDFPSKFGIIPPVTKAQIVDDSTLIATSSSGEHLECRSTRGTGSNPSQVSSSLGFNKTTNTFTSYHCHICSNDVLPNQVLSHVQSHTDCLLTKCPDCDPSSDQLYASDSFVAHVRQCHNGELVGKPNLLVGGESLVNLMKTCFPEV